MFPEIFPGYRKLPWIHLRFRDPVIHQHNRSRRPENFFYAADKRIRQQQFLLISK
jgi:hypothetical protein